MIYARIEAFPNSEGPPDERGLGALVNCWIKRDSIDEAISVARRIIAEHGWHSEKVEVAHTCSRDQFPESGQAYYDQASLDGEVVVFHTYKNARFEKPA